MKNIINIILLIFIAQGCNLPDATEYNAIEGGEKVILKTEGQDEFFYWELEDDKRLWSLDLGTVTGLIQYRDTLKMELGNVLYESAVKKESTQHLEKSLIDEAENGDRINALLVHTGNVGKIRKLNNLEAQVLNYQIERYPMFSKPTEFHAFMVRNEKLEKVRVYFAGSDTEWPPHPNIIIKELEKEENKDWVLIRHLHNHYCKKDENYIGILAPSLADAQYFKMLKERFNIEKALITNGFHTVEIESASFEKFESH